jgi:hypothetical protein
MGVGALFFILGLKLRLDWDKTNRVN